MSLSERLQERLSAQSISQSELARRIGIAQATVANLLSGKSQGSKYIERIARELGTTAAYLTGEVDDLDFGAPARADAASDLNLVPLKQIDLGYGMGGTFLDVPVTAETRYFPREWLRTYTRAAPEELFWATGIGDSMSPTINDSDTMLIDTSQQSVRMADRIWALALGDVGSVKRLRPMPDGTLKIMSDNPAVPEEIAVDGEATIIGRVAALVKKV